MPAPAGSSTLRFFFERRPVENATGAGRATLKGVSKESSDDWSESDACGRPMPIGRDLENRGFDGPGVGGGPHDGPFQAGALGGAIGVLLTLDVADDGVCA